MKRISTTYDALIVEYKTPSIPLASICRAYFGLDLAKASRLAGASKLPVPAFRSGSQKSPWMVHATDLAKLIDDRAAAARAEWEKTSKEKQPA